MYVVFRFLLNFAHFVCHIYYYIQQQCKRLLLTVEKSGFLNKFCYDYSLVNSSKQLIAASKIPRHLTILLGQEEISVIDLVRLISWCIVAEIPYVSFYDQKGILQKNQGLIKKKLRELEPIITQHIEWSNFLNDSVDNIGNVAEIHKFKTNGICTNIIHADATDLIGKYKTKIQILSHKDGKENIVRITKYLANLINLNNLQEQDITAELLDDKLNKNIGLPDPDLAVVFGKTICTYGLLPWQTRVTEFFHIPSHRDISFNSFVETLIKFGKCEQRYGK